MSGVSLSNVVKSFGNTQVLHDISLEITPGELVVLVGPSGCGKSTLLRVISGLEAATGGRIAIGGTDMTEIDPADRGVAMVFQSYALYPHMSVRENIGFGLRMGGMPRAEVTQRVEEAARVLELSELLDRKPKALSGGQRQRVAIGRAIVRQPEVFLFDEPLSNLDAELRVQMRLEIARLHQRLNATMIFVTHDQVEAMTLADRIVVLRAGRIEQVGTPIELYDNPGNQFVAGFIGSPRMNFLPAHVVSGGTEAARLKLDGTDDAEITVSTLSRAVEDGQKVTVGVRPENLSLSAPDGVVLPVSIQMVEHLGGNSFVHTTTATGTPLTVQEQGHARFRAGSDGQISIDAAHCMVFDEDGSRL